MIKHNIFAFLEELRGEDDNKNSGEEEEEGKEK